VPGFDRLAPRHLLAVDHGRQEVAIALAIDWIDEQGIERLACLARDVGMVGRILVAEFVGVGPSDVRAKAMTVPRST
jgi:hypothetical protein